jgi:hypothetical protein
MGDCYLMESPCNSNINLYVTKMFKEIQEYIKGPQALACVLIDKGGSFTCAWQSALMDTVPSDPLRVVNALLTQIHQIQSKVTVMFSAVL